jgi:hypothetical protein
VASNSFHGSVGSITIFFFASSSMVRRFAATADRR